MDPAIIGYCRIGYFRVGVYNVGWDRALTRLKKTATPDKMKIDGAVATVDGRVLRIDVAVPVFEQLKKRLEKA